jgi:hypothetical protein
MVEMRWSDEWALYDNSAGEPVLIEEGVIICSDHALQAALSTADDRWGKVGPCQATEPGILLY